MARLNFGLTETLFEVIEIIERVARHAGALACDGTDGNLVLGGPGATRVASEGARRRRHEGATSAIHGCVAGPSHASRVSRLSGLAGCSVGESSSGRFQVVPPLSPEEFAALKADIERRGVLVPV